MEGADIIFITVGTPSKRLEEDADLSAVWNVAKDIANNIKKYSLVVTKSTVPVGTTKEIKKLYQKLYLKKILMLYPIQSFLEKDLL